MTRGRSTTPDAGGGSDDAGSSPAGAASATPVFAPATSILNRFIPISATDVYRGLISDAAKLGFRTDSLAAVLESIQDAVAREGRQPLVMATVGGGEDGHQLVSAFLDASTGALRASIGVISIPIEHFLQ